MNLRDKLDLWTFLSDLRDKEWMPGILVRFFDWIRYLPFFDDLWRDQYDQTTKG